MIDRKAAQGRSSAGQSRPAINSRRMPLPSRSPVPPSSPGKLRLMLDSASITQYELWLSTGLFHGFTTNPVILKKDGVRCTVKSLTSLAQTGFDLGAQEIQCQAWGSSVAEMSSIAYDLAGIDPNRVVVKLPCTLEGVQVASLMRESNVRVTLTGVFSTPQILVAQAVGAEYAAPYLGRMNDAYGPEQGHQTVIEMQRMLSGCSSSCRLLVASIRDATEMAKLCAAGCNTFTMSPQIAAKLFNNAFTIDAVAEFAAAAKANGGEEDMLGGNLAMPIASLRSSGMGSKEIGAYVDGRTVTMEGSP